MGAGVAIVANPRSDHRPAAIAGEGEATQARRPWCTFAFARADLTLGRVDFTITRWNCWLAHPGLALGRAAQALTGIAARAIGEGGVLATQGSAGVESARVAVVAQRCYGLADADEAGAGGFTETGSCRAGAGVGHGDNVAAAIIARSEPASGKFAKDHHALCGACAGRADVLPCVTVASGVCGPDVVGSGCIRWGGWQYAKTC